MPFTALGLCPALVRAVVERKYSAPTPVQLATIPAVLRGRDVWAQAQTGSGKTAAFALPILEHLQSKPPRGGRSPTALILAPTRELAAQIGESFRGYAQFLSRRLKIVTTTGGVSINPQLLALRGGAEVVIATPGRLLDVIEHNALQLSGTETLVLDEADQLFALGFSDELRRILALLPEKRQNLLFSATFPPDVVALAEGLLRDPERIQVESTLATKPAIFERAIEVDAPRRTQLLRHLIETQSWSRVLVFVATQYATEHVSEKLRRTGLAASALHGELSQGARTTALAQFKSGETQVLVATDIAARGLDVVDLPVVVNYDLPRSTIIYTHRIGRTGRAGAKGIAVSFVSAATHDHFCLIEKRHDRSIPREQVEGFEPAEVAPPPSLVAPDGGGIKGKRKSKKDKLREAAERIVPSRVRPHSSDPVADSVVHETAGPKPTPPPPSSGSKRPTRSDPTPRPDRGDRSSGRSSFSPPPPPVSAWPRLPGRPRSR